MKRFFIPECNMERLEKKLTRIKNKCEKYGIEFAYNKVGEIIKETDTEGEFIKYIEIEVDGTAVINGWRFIATIEHKSGVNVVRQYDNSVDIPSKFYTSPATCEHCNSARNRKDTYLVLNEESGEIKQVGKSCLLDYTSGLSAQNVAAFMEGFELEDYFEPMGPSFRHFLEVREYLPYAIETTRIFGFVPSSSVFSTKNQIEECRRIYKGDVRKHDEETLKMMEIGKFNPDSEEVAAMVEDIILWAKSVDRENCSNYMLNVNAIFQSDYAEYRDKGFLASVPNSYNNYVESQQKKQEEEKKRAAINNTFIGKIGDKVSLKVKECKAVTSYSTQFGVTIIYRFLAEDDNVIIWKTSVGFETENVKEVSGRVKAHNEYNGEKQTVLTRCKVS